MENMFQRGRIPERIVQTRRWLPRQCAFHECQPEICDGDDNDEHDKRGKRYCHIHFIRCGINEISQAAAGRDEFTDDCTGHRLGN